MNISRAVLRNTLLCITSDFEQSAATISCVNDVLKNAISGIAKITSDCASTSPSISKQKAVSETLFVPIAKADSEQQTVTGVVLQPEVVDAQGDIISKSVIQKAAHRFIDQFNQRTKLGLQHNSFKGGRFSLAESYIAPMSFVLNGKTVSEGSWVMVVKVLDSKIWKRVKDGMITGFSIGGKAQVTKA